MNICFDCANAYAHKCEKIAHGTPIDGWTAKELSGGGYDVKACPNYKCDFMQTNFDEMGKILGKSKSSARYYEEIGTLSNMLKEKGYILITEKVEKRNRYFFKLI